MSNRVLIRRDTAANWTTYNPVLLAGEQGFETDTKYMKIGDGSTAWSSLLYFVQAAGASPAGALTGTTLASNVVTSSLTSLGTLGTLTVTATITGSVSGNAGTVTNGIYTTDTGTVTNTMLAGSISNAKLSNSSLTVNGISISLGGSQTVTAAAGTLTGTTLNSTVVTSSLTSLGNQTQALNMNSHQINNVSDPSSAQDAATKNYVDSAINGLDWKQSCTFATTVNLAGTYLSNVFTLTGTGVLTVDGHTVVLNDTALFKNQTGTGGTATANGIYTCTTAGAIGIAAVFTRRSDYNTSAEIQSGDTIYIQEGTTNGGTAWTLTTQPTITLDTTSLTFTQTSGPGTIAAGSGISISGTTVSVATSGVTNAMLAGSIAASNLVGTDIATVGTITSGTWHGTLVSPTYGGTGTNNGSNTLTIGASASVSGSNTGDQTISDATISTTDITTNNVSTSKHGFAPKAPNDATKYLDGTGVYSTPPGGTGSLNYNAQTATYAPVSGDLSKLVDFTGSSNTTFTLTSAATLGAGWFCWIRNSGTSNAQLTLASSSGTIDGVATTGYIMYSGEVRLVQSNGTNFHSIVINGGSAVFNSSTTWQRPPGYTSFQVEVIHGGGSGACRTTTGVAGGGAGGNRQVALIPASALVAVGSTETITIGAGVSAVSSSNANGNVGNNSNFTFNGVVPSVTVGTAAGNGNTAGAGGTGGSSPYLSFDIGITGGSGSGSVSIIGGNTTISFYNPLYSMGGGGGGAAAADSGTWNNTSGGTGAGSLIAGAGGNGSSNTGNTGGAAGNGVAPGGGGGAGIGGAASGSGAKGQVTVRGII